MYYIFLIFCVTVITGTLIGFKKGKFGTYYRKPPLFLREFVLLEGIKLYLTGIPILIFSFLISAYSIYKINYEANHYVATLVTISFSILTGWWLYSITPQSYKESDKDEKSLISKRTLKIIFLTALGFIFFVVMIFVVGVSEGLVSEFKPNLNDQINKITQSINSLF